MCVGEGGECVGKPPCVRGMPVKGLLQIAVLELVREGPNYGGRIQRLLRERFMINVPRGVVYDVLQRLEGRGFLQSSWDTSGGGPARRVYRLTVEGEEFLTRVLLRLREVERLIKELLSGEGSGSGGC